ncbi:DNA-methyltransferase [Halapricum hydrolyticum]|uniref:Type II methyltransferase n=1 Tax=Halapricum hydrolyticum TaxID=2979991 RepID=A0AAE3IAF7_9EURY|nr:site-specific DNA-methyltransferase [Halapricum hydrolyticum]MCU4718415.1 site-specific DNA-methyltransferase [Halapricum hydrolyticum]MCU4726472.1 site-specific DNA-methyltransferase [Halapricum hydrolyticum]
METSHRIVTGDARSLETVEDDSVELVVTSPPYPMIEMWDELFADLDPEVATHLEAGDGEAAFERMHEQLDAVWGELRRVLVDGGIACVNVGDATRSIGGRFRVFRNHDRISDAFEALGFDPLPEILWRKPANSGAKFMGSGMVPPNAYVTLEHEYVLVFRNGADSREFEPRAERRYDAAYFWEERNRWFSDVWTDVRGALQTLDSEGSDGDDLRDRSAAFPFEIPYRLINMYSVYGDTVLDPFWGTGTTSMAAMVAGRNSIGYELNEEFRTVFDERVQGLPERSRDVIDRRLRAHLEFVSQHRADGETFEYEADRYGFPVRTKQERAITFYEVRDVYRTGNGYAVAHEPVEEVPDLSASPRDAE